MSRRAQQVFAAFTLLILGSVGAASCSDPQGGVAQFTELRWETWEGQPLASADFARWIQGGTDALPVPAQVVVYRSDCGICSQHLAGLDRTAGRVPLVLIHVPDERQPEAANDARTFAPEHHVHLELLPLERGYGFVAPVTFYVDATRTVRQVRDAVALGEMR